MIRNNNVRSNVVLVQIVSLKLRLDVHWFDCLLAKWEFRKNQLVAAWNCISN